MVDYLLCGDALRRINLQAARYEVFRVRIYCVPVPLGKGQLAGAYWILPGLEPYLYPPQSVGRYPTHISYSMTPRLQMSTAVSIYTP